LNGIVLILLFWIVVDGWEDGIMFSVSIGFTVILLLYIDKSNELSGYNPLLIKEEYGSIYKYEKKNSIIISVNVYIIK